MIRARPSLDLTTQALSFIQVTKKQEAHVTQPLLFSQPATAVARTPILRLLRRALLLFTTMKWFNKFHSYLS